MPDNKSATEALSYATPAVLRSRYPVVAVASIVVTVLSALFATLMSFREGLTNTEAHQQMMVGRISGTVGGVVALVLAVLSYRRRFPSHASSHVAVTLSIAAILYIITQLPPW